MDGRRERLYAVEPTDFAGASKSAPVRARLLALDPLTLELERDYMLPAMAWTLAVAPDGRRAYNLAPGGRAVWRTDLGTGASTPLLPLHGHGSDLVVTDDRVYVAIVMGSEVWAIDRRSGRLTAAIAGGRHPAALALAPPTALPT